MCNEDTDQILAIMARKDRLLLKIQNNPRNARFADVRQLLLDAGFSERQPRGGSSHVIFYHIALEQIVVLTMARGVLPEYQVKDALKALIALAGGYEQE